jgi:hypothetical protein
MANFGALTDHWGIATTDLVLVASDETPVAKSVERAQDEDGDNVDEESHGQTEAGTLADVSCTYALKSGTLNLNTLKCGEIESTKIVAGIDVTTANGEWPQITVSGQTGCIAVNTPTGKLNTFTLPSVTIAGRKQAQLLGFTIGAAAGRLTGSTFNASIDIATQADGLGVIVAHAVSGGVMSVSADQVYVDATPTWTAPSGWIETQTESNEEPQAAFHTSTMTAEKILDRDTPPA